MNPQWHVNNDNVMLLNETKIILQSMTLEAYTHKSLLFNADTPGAHVRHILEHYELFLEGLSSGHINYDLRKRNLKLSADPKAAIAKIEELTGQLEILTVQDLSLIVAVKMDTGKVCEEVKSSVGRELQFLLSHHVHHNAIIRMIMESSGEVAAKDFGVASSTVKYQNKEDQCAR